MKAKCPACLGISRCLLCEDTGYIEVNIGEGMAVDKVCKKCGQCIGGGVAASEKELLMIKANAEKYAACPYCGSSGAHVVGVRIEGGAT